MAIDPIMLALMRRGGSGGGGVQADYAQNDPQAADYIKNRPGGYYDGWEITWDGEVGDRLVVNNGEGEQMVKVSDKTPTIGELLGGEITLWGEVGEETFPIAAKDVSSNPFGVSVREDVLAIHEPFETFTETGTYFRKNQHTGAYVKSVGNKTLVKIPAELTTMEGGYAKSTVLFDGVIQSDKLYVQPE